MRIDVHLPPERIERDLAAIEQRLPALAATLAPLPGIEASLPQYAVACRSIDAGVFVYVQHARQRRLAGYVAFMHVAHLARAGHGCVYSPHAKFGPAHQRRGIATAVYRWMLDGGACLLSGARQSEASHRLWLSLGRRGELGYARVTGRSLRELGAQAPEAAYADLETRLLLRGPRSGAYSGLLPSSPGVAADPSWNCASCATSSAP